MVQILGLLSMHFDAMVVEVEKYLLFFRLAQAILWESDLVFNYLTFISDKACLHFKWLTTIYERPKRNEYLGKYVPK